jgi:predicted alpha/beta-fold hydrolase
MHDRLERVATSDGDHLTLARMGKARPGVPHLLITHGLEATIGANYAHGLLEQAKQRGWSGDLLLFRTCDGELNSARRLYHSGETTDLDFIVRRQRREYPESPLMLCGVSLGGNVLLKWLGEQRETANQLVSRAAAVSVPFDLAKCSRALEHGFSRLYARHFLKTLAPKALKKAEQHPGAIDVERARRARTFWEFDDAATAPLHGFADAADYYARSSSIRFLRDITVPTLLFSALDDPFVPRDVYREVATICADSMALRDDFTSTGGHVGWVEGLPWAARYFMELRIFEFFANGL